MAKNDIKTLTTMKWFQFSWFTKSSLDRHKLIVHVEYRRFNSLQEAKNSANGRFGQLLHGEGYRCDGYAVIEDVQKYASNLQIPPEDNLWDIINNPIYYGKN